ncbi:hypothetical protein [Coleofasciculus sp.]
MTSKNKVLISFEGQQHLVDEEIANDDTAFLSLVRYSSNNE